jgi:hypothetical protein
MWSVTFVLRVIPILRKRVEFPEPIDFRLLEDGDDGSNDSGYYGSQSRKRGKELESLARLFLQRAGILTLP